jgi:hypothetical protein
MSEEYSPVQGGCLCGAVRYDAAVALRNAYYCHCKLCQKTSGAPAQIGVLVKVGTLKFTKGEPRFFQSSPLGKRGFCEQCGSQLIWTEPDVLNSKWTNVSVGSLDNPEQVVPVEHTCVESQLPWYNLADELPRKRTDDDPELVEAWARAGLTHDGKAI